MAKQKADGISWCDETINPWWGCSRVHGSPACEDPTDPTKIICYAESDVRRYGYNDLPGASHFQIWGERAQRRFFGDKPFQRIAAMNRKWREAQRRGRAFVMSFGDWAEGRPDQVPYLAKLWPAIAEAESVNFLMLTKRPQLITKLCPFSRCFGKLSKELELDPKYYVYGAPLGTERVWLGTTAENQPWLDIRWEHLKAAIRDRYQIAWLSIEPQVGPIKLPQDFLDRGGRSWVVVGGMSGKDAVQFDPAWARSLRDQCREAGVPFHMKQMSGNTKAALKAIPTDLMIREWPETAELAMW